MFYEKKGFGSMEPKPSADRAGSAPEEVEDALDPESLAAIETIRTLPTRKLFSAETSPSSPQLHINNHSIPAVGALKFLDTKYGMPVLDALYERMCKEMRRDLVSAPEKVSLGHPTEQKTETIMRIALLKLLNVADEDIERLYPKDIYYAEKEYSRAFVKFAKRVEEKWEKRTGSKDASEDTDTLERQE